MDKTKWGVWQKYGQALWWKNCSWFSWERENYLGFIQALSEVSSLWKCSYIAYYKYWSFFCCHDMVNDILVETCSVLILLRTTQRWAIVITWCPSFVAHPHFWTLKRSIYYSIIMKPCQNIYLDNCSASFIYASCRVKNKV